MDVFNIFEALRGHLDNISTNISQCRLVWSLLGGELALILAAFLSILKRWWRKNYYTGNCIDEFSAWCLWNRSSSPAMAEQRISLIIAKEEGWISRVLDFCRVTSPLLGLAGTLIGLQFAFSNAGQGKAAIESGLATALDTTYAGIIIAIFSFFVMKLVLQPYLEGLSAQLLEEFHNQADRLKREARREQEEPTHKNLLSSKEGKLDEFID